jgi:hypothetical protein
MQRALIGFLLFLICPLYTTLYSYVMRYLYSLPPWFSIIILSNTAFCSRNFHLFWGKCSLFFQAKTEWGIWFPWLICCFFTHLGTDITSFPGTFPCSEFLESERPSPKDPNTGEFNCALSLKRSGDEETNLGLHNDNDYIKCVLYPQGFHRLNFVFRKLPSTSQLLKIPFNSGDSKMVCAIKKKM